MRSWKPRTLAQWLLTGAGIGLLSGAVGLLVSTGLASSSLREVPLITYVFADPVFGIFVGYILWRNACINQPAASSEHEKSPEAYERRRARRQRYLVRGIALGCAMAVMATACDVSWLGWRALGAPALTNLMLFPYFGVLLAVNLTRGPGERPSLPRCRLNISMLMVLIAYLAVLLGVGVEGGRIGGAAQRYHIQSLNAASQADLFRKFARKSIVEAPLRRANAKQLRAGEIPDGIMAGQKRFLASLADAKPDYRTYRFGLIADGEDLQGRSAEANIVEFTKLTDYFDGLAAKYTRAERRPWAPVAPDGPRP